MFHRANGGAIQPQTKKAAAAQNEARQEAQKIGMDQPAVRQYHKPQKEGEDIYSANENSGVPYAVQQAQQSNFNTINQETKEAKTMNNPQAKNTSQPEASGRQLSIGQGITMSGEIEACDHLVVEGTVEAALKGASLLEITESGSFFGTVEIEEATIAGRFEGDIHWW